MMMMIDDDDDDGDNGGGDETTTKWCWWRRWWWSYNKNIPVWCDMTINCRLGNVYAGSHSCMKCLTTQEDEIRINLSDLEYWYTCTFISFVLVESPNTLGKNTLI